MARQMNYFAYTSDDGTTQYSIKVPQDIADTTLLGFTRSVGLVGTPDATHPAPPRNFRPRKVYLRDTATGRSRAVTVATPAALNTLVTTPGETVSLFEMNSITATSWKVTGGRGQKITPPHLIH